VQRHWKKRREEKARSTADSGKETQLVLSENIRKVENAPSKTEKIEKAGKKRTN
jgi:hypothetical protein